MRALLNRRVPTTDGAELATDVYLPHGGGSFPVVLIRTPYHRAYATGGDPAGMSRVDYFIDRGYALAVQDVRGKYDSTGTFRPLVDEAVDGQKTIDWIAEQRWCNGRVGMAGLSYLGIVQVPAAAGGHEALRCITPQVAPQSFFTDWIRYDGCFALANMVRWPFTHNVCSTKPTAGHFTWKELVGLSSLAEIEERVGAVAPELRRWVEHDRYDDYWRAIDQHEMYDSVGAAGMHAGGWFDHLTRGQFQAWRGISDRGASDRARTSQRLVIGPWGHSRGGTREYGDWDFGPEAALSFVNYRQRFLDLWLRDIDDGIAEEPPVKLFLMGENRWIGLDDWPPREAREQDWYLHSGGSAAGIGGDGRLNREEPGAESADQFTYDPSDPVPTHGGQIYWGMTGVGIAKAGPVEQRQVLARDDVLYYRGERLPEPLRVIGEVELDLWVASDAEDTDVIAKLCVVEPDGRVTSLLVGSLRLRYRDSWSDPRPLSPGDPTQIRVHIGNLAYTFPAGSRVALMVTSSDFPRILPHPNTMEATWSDAPAHVARQTVLHDAEHPSRLVLPVVEG
jgi:putative CocE/NonD family hydrolase